MSFKPIITDAGLEAAMLAEQNSVKVTINEIALGDKGYAPSAAITKLQNERARIKLSGEKISKTQLHFEAILSDGDFWVREIGFYTDKNILFAVWSNADKPFAYKAPDVDLVLALELIVASLPSDIINVTTGDFALPVATTEKRGIIKIATNDEAFRGVNGALAVTPWQLKDSHEGLKQICKKNIQDLSNSLDSDIRRARNDLQNNITSTRNDLQNNIQLNAEKIDSEAERITSAYETADSQLLQKIHSVERNLDAEANARAKGDKDASLLTQGTLPAARLPNIDAGKITSGVIAKERLPAGTGDNFGIYDPNKYYPTGSIWFFYDKGSTTKGGWYECYHPHGSHGNDPRTDPRSTSRHHFLNSPQPSVWLYHGQMPIGLPVGTIVPIADRLVKLPLPLMPMTGFLVTAVLWRLQKIYGNSRNTLVPPMANGLTVVQGTDYLSTAQGAVPANLAGTFILPFQSDTRLQSSASGAFSRIAGPRAEVMPPAGSNAYYTVFNYHPASLGTTNQNFPAGIVANFAIRI